jgi:transcriptional regulator with XRE-family HTH domain
LEARKRTGLTQGELGEKVGVGGSYISRLERGIYPPPSRDVVLGLADALGMSDKADLNRIQFLSAAGVLSDEDLQEFELVKVGGNNGGQSTTQSAPAQQLQSTAGINGAVMQQILILLQQLTATVAELTAAVVQLQAQVAALQQPNTAVPTRSDVPPEDPVKQAPQPSGEQSPGKAPFLIVGIPPEEALAKGVRKVEESKESEVIINWDRRIRPARTIAEIEKWDKYWTRIYEQQGSLLIVMKGLQGMTLHKDHYKARLQPILKDNETAKLLRVILDRLDRRRMAFEEQVQTYVFRHIMPIDALDWYVQTGYSRIDDYGLILGGLPAPMHQRAADICHIIDLLEDPKYAKYHLGLLTGERSKLPIYDTSFLELKGSQGLILENLANGERNAINTAQMLNDWFCEFFETLWRSKGMITDREEVRETLRPYAKKAKRLAEAPARS